MYLKFGIEQYKMSNRLSGYPKIGLLISKIFGITNVGQFARANIFKRLITSLPIQEMNNILDLGCGQGEYALMMSRTYPEVAITGLDIEKVRIDKIKKLAASIELKNLKTHHGLIDSLDADGAFDLVYSVDVFEHILEHDMPFNQAYKKLKPGGHLLVKMPSKKQIIVLPERWFEDHNQWLDDEHIGQVYELNDLSERMRKEGFVVREAFYADGILSRLAWELAYLSKKAGPVVQLLALPFLKGMVLLDRLILTRNKGNTIQVIAQKPN